MYMYRYVRYVKNMCVCVRFSYTIQLHIKRANSADLCAVFVGQTQEHKVKCDILGVQVGKMFLPWPMLVVISQVAEGS